MNLSVIMVEHSNNVGEKILSQSKINDNFCDCKDGTDETCNF